MEVRKKIIFFDIRGGERVVNGKPIWPETLELKVKRKDAWHMLKDLVHLMTDEGEEITLTFVGQGGEILYRQLDKKR